MSTLMFWNKQQNGQEGTKGKKTWLHAPDNLVDGHIVYRAKFLGKCSVDQPKGIDVVKDAIRRLQFAQQLKKSEQGNNVKIKKVELSVSINGVAVRDLPSQAIMHQYPLYRISYCADEKGEKKYFSFIAKTSTENERTSLNGTATDNDSVVPSLEKEKHECYVFISSKNASDITLTIGQAFDLAYTRYKKDSTKLTELGAMQSKNKNLEKTVSLYRQRLKELSENVPSNTLEQLLHRLGIKDILEVPMEPDQEMNNNNNNDSMFHLNGNGTGKKAGTEDPEMHSSNDGQLLIETCDDEMKQYPPVPSRNLQNQFNTTLDAFKGNSTNGNGKSDGLLLNSDSDSDFDPRANEGDTMNGNKIANDMFGFEPHKTLGQQIFSATNNHSSFVNNMNTVNNSMTNGFNSQPPQQPPPTLALNNGNNSPISPPLLAPPPKASTPRRSGPLQLTNTNMDGNQDLFGSTPFHAAPIAFDTFSKTTFGADDFSLESLDPLRK